MKEKGNEQKRPKDRYYEGHGGENMVTPLHQDRNEFNAGNLRTINAELLMYCFGCSWVASENALASLLSLVLEPPSAWNCAPFAVHCLLYRKVFRDSVLYYSTLCHHRLCTAAFETGNLQWHSPRWVSMFIAV